MSPDLDHAFTSELSRRAAAHLCDRLEAPERGPPAGDDPLAALIAELAVRAADTHAPQAALESEALTLELTRLDREISATRAGTGNVAPLVSRRQDLRDRAIALATERTQPAE